MVLPFWSRSLLRNALSGARSFCKCKAEIECVCRPVAEEEKKKKSNLPKYVLLLLIGAGGGAYYVANFCPDTMAKLEEDNNPVHPYLKMLKLGEAEPAAGDKKKKK